MSLPEFSIKKKVTVYMVTAAFILLGVLAFQRLPQELFPPITFPQVTIVTDYSNAAPEEIETLITRVIEESIGSVAGLKRIESSSREGRSTIIASFNWGQDIDFAALAIREKVDLIKERLPKESDDPVVLKFDPLSRPILILSVTGTNIPPVRLKFLAEKILKDRLEKVEGVASVTISGGVNREILVEIDMPRLQANHLSLLEVVDSLDEANISYPAGSIKKGLYEYLIRTVGDFRSVAEIHHAVVGVDNVEKARREEASFIERDYSEGPRRTIDRSREEVEQKMLEKRLVLVKDIGNAIDGLAEKTSISRYNDSENISISIQKQSNANTIQVVDRLRRELGALREDIESRGVQSKIIYDHSVFIRQTLENLVHEAVMGGLLALATLWIFLRALSVSFLVIISIPLSMLGVFFMMAMGNITVNIMSLGGLAISIGMVIDTSIVVLENIFRRRQLGDLPEKGAVEATNEVTWPVVSSNLSTIAVFFPLIVFVPGVAGQIFKDLSWAIIFSQIFSTFIPLTLVAMLSTYINVPQKDYRPFSLTGSLDRYILGLPTEKEQNRLMGTILLSVIVLLLLSIFLVVPTIDREVLPKLDQGQFSVKVDMPLGTRLDVTDQVCRTLEKKIRTIPEVEDISTSIGSEKTGRGEIKIETLRPSQALIFVSLKKDRKRSSSQVVSELSDMTKALDLAAQGAKIEFMLQESEFAVVGTGSKPILVEVKGYDFSTMEKLVHRLKGKLSTIPGVMNVQDDIGKKSPETKLEINKKRAALYGISALDISLTAKAAIEGVVATQYREGGREVDVRVRLNEADRSDIDNLGDLLLYSKILDVHVPLKEIALIERGEGPSEIKRSDQERTVTISAEISKDRKDKDVLAAVQKLLASLRIPDDIPQDFQVKLSGKAKEIKENFGGVIFAFVLAVMLVYMIMAAQFESFLQPLIIMITIPLSFAGAVLAIKISGHSFNVISLLGLVLLEGVVVNNGIVLMEYINQLRAEGVEMVEAVWQATRTRTRPVLMTSTTTIMGMLPVALGIGEGGGILAPLSVTIMGGLFSSTVLTLLVLPCLYILVNRILDRFFSYDDLPEADETIEGSLPQT
ncbi:MAG TPA: efflux RND transporter permease subunit [Candidatus Omnitrophota bacterium]|jgi:HAE1 family hydrophobic/amphiphilic exporter-1|nr:efflux RND transporter permease subunit [Candidatus Omnitrophota bacterium]HQB12112.1 efflux RND transporter permease subunit [Candidatus Omnitrophota bacterium]